MPDILETIKGRRSIRKYIDKQVEEDALKKILESVKWSPSWANTQCWEVVVVRDQANKRGLQKTMAKNPAEKAMVQAPIVLVICAKLERSGYYKGQITTKFGDWFMFDLGIVTQSICLTAYDLGLGTVIVGLFDHNMAKKTLGMENGYEVVAMIPVGYPDEEPKAPKRREIEEFTRYENFVSK